MMRRASRFVGLVALVGASLGLMVAAPASADQLPAPSGPAAVYAVCSMDIRNYTNHNSAIFAASCNYAPGIPNGKFGEPLLPYKLGYTFTMDWDAGQVYGGNSGCNPQYRDQIVPATEMGEGTGDQGGALTFACKADMRFNSDYALDHEFKGGPTTDPNAGSLAWYTGSTANEDTFPANYTSAGKSQNPQYIEFCPAGVSPANAYSIGQGGYCLFRPATIHYRALSGTNDGYPNAMTTATPPTLYPSFPYDYFVGGNAGQSGAPPPPPPPPAACAITSVAANWPDDGAQMSTQYELQVTYTGEATTLYVVWADGRSDTVFTPAPASVASLAVYWDQVGQYSAEVHCTSADGTSSGWAIPVTVVQQSKSLTACLPDSIGSVLSPAAWVKAMGCVLQWAFIPSPNTKEQMGSMWDTAKTKAPFSFVYDVATFLPNTAHALNEGVHDTSDPNIIGDGPACASFIDNHPLSGGGLNGDGPLVDGCIDTQLDNTGLAPWAATVRVIIIALVLITLALGVWRMTTKAIG